MDRIKDRETEYRFLSQTRILENNIRDKYNLILHGSMKIRCMTFE